MRKIAVIVSMVLLSGCATTVSTPPANCSEFIPVGWKAPIEGYPLPADDELKSWQLFGVGQTGNLSKANARQSDTIHIFETCERRTNLSRPRKRLLGVF